jgi:molecular chaperone GrpE (heat shock protein)
MYTRCFELGMSSESTWELLVQERIRELEASTARLRETEQRLAAELDTLQRLQQVATQIISVDAAGALFEQFLDAVSGN